MKKLLTEEQIRFFENTISDIIVLPEYENLKTFKQHRFTNTYDHSLSVAYNSYLIALNKKKIDLKSLIRGAMLHDFVSYDWHKQKKFSFHGYRHPKKAYLNASRFFTVNETEKDIIVNHMWPLTIFHFPKTREGWIVSLTDTFQAIIEMFKKNQKPDIKININK